MEPGQFLLRLGWLGTYVQTRHDDTADVIGQGNIPIIHDQDLAITEARLALDVGLTERFAASLVVPLRVVSTSIVYRDGRGAPVQLREPNTHHRNETLTGIADPMVLGGFTHMLGATRLTARAGVTIPLGRTEEDPFALGDMGEAHQHIQMGTGTFNPVLALEASHRVGHWRFGGFLFTQQVLYENGKGFHAGDRYAAGLSLHRAIGGRFGVRFGPEMQGETAEMWNGVKHADEGNQGRFDAILGAAVTWTPIPAWTFDAAVKVPVYTHVVGGQLEAPAIVEIGAAWTFGGAGNKARTDGDHDHAGEHDHDHDGDHAGEHGHEHDKDHASDHDQHRHDKPSPGSSRLDTTGADVADAGTGGARVDLVPVTGKITIYDFWAEWCEPCKTLEPVLVELARAHPDRVAIRRVDVIDWDSPVAAQHLTPGGFGLPHLKVFDAKGTLVLEQSSAPGKLTALIDAVRAIVAAPAQPATTAPAPATPPAATPTKPRATAPKPLVIEIEVTSKGFEPGDLKVPSGRPVTLRFHRTFARTCATEVVFDADGKRIVKDLPLGKVVDLTLTFTKRGTIPYACAMNMIGGTITVQ